MDTPVLQARLSRNGEWLAYIGQQQAVYARRMTGSDTTPRLLVPGRYNVLSITISPNGRWLAYTATETGAREVFVRPFPDTGATRWQVSTSGGLFPLWSPDSRELYFFASGRLVAAELEAGPIFGVKAQRTLSVPGTGVTATSALDVAPDGRFIGLRPVEISSGVTREIVVVENFAEELRARPKR
jgi:serine/threonine-protein kinase